MSQGQPPQQSQIHEALRFLADRCDGAMSYDGQGFNKFDAQRGRALAAQSRLYPEDEAQALRMLQKYRGQLEQGGFDFDRMLADFGEQHRSNGNGSEPSTSERSIVQDGDVLVLQFPFPNSMEIRQAIKRIRGWQWNSPAHPKRWTVPVSALEQVEDLAARFDFEMGEITAPQAPAGEPAAPSPVYDRTVDVAGDVFVISSSYAPDLVKPLRNLPGRRWDPPEHPKKNTVPVSSAAYVREFAREHHFMVSGAAEDLFAAAPSIEQIVRTQRWIDVDDDGWWGRQFIVHSEFNGELLDAIHLIPNRHWDAYRKVSEFPLEQCLEVERYGQRFDFQFSDAARKVIEEFREAARREQERIAALIAASKAKKPSAAFRIPFDSGVMFPFQVAGVEYLLDHAEGRSFNGDDMGIGKTIQALAAAEWLHQRSGGKYGYPLLITCPKSLVLNWRKEIRLWHRKWGVERTVEIVRSQGAAGLFGRADITIIHHEAMRNRMEVIAGGGFNGMINDESHCFKNKGAMRTKLALTAASQIDCDQPLILNLTGTAFVNGRPAELIPQLQILRRLEDFGGYHAFYKRYCGGNERSSQLLNELGVELRARCFLRRLKFDVLEDLPARLISRVEVDIDNEKEYRYAEAEFLTWLREKNGPEAAARAARAEMLVKMNHLRQLVAFGKMPAAIEWAKNNIESGNKMVLFAHHQPVQERVARELAAFNPRVIKAGQKDEERERNVEEFQEDERVMAMVASLQSGSVGLTLTASSNPALLELPWTPKDYNQAIDRCHRHGQRDSVTGWPIVHPGSIDDYMEQILAEKGAAASAALDGTAGVDEDESIMVEVARRMLERGDR